MPNQPIHIELWPSTGSAFELQNIKFMIETDGDDSFSSLP